MISEEYHHSSNLLLEKYSPLMMYGITRHHCLFLDLTVMHNKSLHHQIHDDFDTNVKGGRGWEKKKMHTQSGQNSSRYLMKTKSGFLFFMRNIPRKDNIRVGWRTPPKDNKTFQSYQIMRMSPPRSMRRSPPRRSMLYTVVPYRRRIFKNPFVSFFP